MANFLDSVSDELLRRFSWEELKDVTLVFPMHRAGVVMRSILQQRMAAEHRTPLWAPEIVALGDLFDSLCPLGKEDELFSVCRLHRIYAECIGEGAMEIDRFYGWGRQLLSDFTNIDQAIASNELESFFRNALTLANLDTYKLDDEVRRRLEDLLYKGEARRQALIAESVQAHFAALWKVLPTIYHRLGDELLSNGKGYEGQRMRYVISHWPELRERATSRNYCFIGFNYLLPVERQLMQLLHDEQRALFFWDYVADFRTNTKAFAFIRQNMRTLPNALPDSTWGAPRQIRTISATSAHAEAEYAGTWLQKTYQQRGEATAIIICDEAQLEPVIYSLPSVRLSDTDLPEDINITKGFPLRNTPIFAEVIKKLSTLGSRLSPPTSQLSALIAFVDEQSARSMQAQQNTWQWHLQREALYQTRRALIQFSHLISEQLVHELPEHPDLLMRLIRRHMEQITLPFHGEPITDLQVMGVLETRALDFRHLLLLNVEEGVIPAHQPDKSFLPYYLRKAYGLQTHDERASVYAYNFFRLLHRADDVTILFSQSQTAMTKKTMSRFVMQMLICPEEFTVSKFTLTESNNLLHAPAIIIPDNTSWHDAKLSPSAINTFYGCKRKFYLEYILHLREDDEQEPIFSNRTLGLFVHEAVHYLYQKYCHCDNTREVHIHPNQVDEMNTPANRQEAIRTAYDRLNNPTNDTQNHSPANPLYVYEQHALENHVIDTYIEHILARDRYDAEHRGLTILLLEYPLYTNVNCQLSNGNCQLTIGGRLDRMDRVGGMNGFHEVTRIVDYKCGTYNAKKMAAATKDLLTHEKADMDYVRQTLIYSFVAYHSRNCQIANIEPHLYFTAQDLTSERTVTRVALDKEDITYDDEHDKQYTDLVQQMIQDILSEREFPQCEKCSRYCPFLRLCARQPSAY